MHLRTGSAALALTALAATLTACDLPWSGGPDPEPVLEKLAVALEAGDVPADMEPVLAEVADLPHSVTAAPAKIEEDAATSALTWQWEVAGEPWEYDVPVELNLVGDEWQFDWTPTLIHPELTDGDTLDTTTINSARGPITGAGDLPLVTGRDVVRFGIDRSLIDPAQADASARALAALMQVDPERFATSVVKAGPKAFVEAIALRTEDVDPAVSAGLEAIPGARAVPGTQQLGPTRGFAAPIVGTVGPVTAEMVEEKPDTYAAGDVAGLSGLQARYDDQLRGTPGLVINRVTGDGEEELFRVDQVDGQPLATTLDENLQVAAEKILADVGPASALVAIRPSDGAILAAANGPGAGGYNNATFGQLAPGSTFKTVSTLALLRAGLTPETPVPCTASIVVDGKPFENYDDYPDDRLGTIPLRSALANSCNTAFISQRDKIPAGGLAEAAAALGLGVDHDLGFPAYFGQVEPPASDTEGAADMIGQGSVLASPMTMASVIGSVQAGHTVVPKLLTSTVATEQTPIPEAEALRGMMRGVVTDGSGTFLNALPGPPVIAKTGTAEFDRDGKRLLHAWMVAAQGDLAVAAFVDEGVGGRVTAGPLLEAMLRAGR
ncbi:penicillin-binding transpeptidase domain-containing protein [Nocardioides sp. InS609-2]|uniref:penicillin-binding transpeptidase domain-containing protein n=1 Tax=Nocardioides sp. InS609-2 TaxID=2760705 RepID=UPI0020C035C6|nr:penicillin-binding transpeptidase domain-containing protein [Nocardioides sp. InS609-2]